MAHKCKCLYCGIEFDRDKLPYVQVTERRYAHKECAERNQVEKTKSEQDYDTLVEYIKKLLGDKYVDIKVTKQIKDFRQQYQYTYSGMYWALVYWFEVKRAPLDAANGGIGIVPYIYDQAKAYYSKIYTANVLNSDIKDYQAKIIDITMPSPQPQPRNVRLFNLDIEEENNE